MTEIDAVPDERLEELAATSEAQGDLEGAATFRRLLEARREQHQELEHLRERAARARRATNPTARHLEAAEHAQQDPYFSSAWTKANEEAERAGVTGPTGRHLQLAIAAYGSQRKRDAARS